MKKVKQIAKAYTNPVPSGESWYQKRLAICDTCPLNSKNVEKAGKTWFREHVVKKACDKGEYCTACGCCNDRKASLKVSVCGRVEIDESPLWPAIEIENEDRYFYSVENLTYDNCDLSYVRRGRNITYILDFKETSELVLKAEVKTFSPPKCKFISLEKDSCFFVNTKQEEDAIILEISLPMKGQRIGNLSKELTLHFEQKKGETKINFKILAVKNGL